MVLVREQMAKDEAAQKEAEAKYAEEMKTKIAKAREEREAKLAAIAAVRANALADGATSATAPPPDSANPADCGDGANETEAVKLTEEQLAKKREELELELTKRRDKFRQCFCPSEADLDAAKKALEAEFAACSTGRQFGEGLMNRPDLFRFFLDLRPSDVCGRDAATGLFGEDAVAKGLARTRVGLLFDAVLELQLGLTSFEGRALSKGLTFDSFRVALHKAGIAIGLHFRHLADDALESFVEAASSASRAQMPMAREHALTSRKPPVAEAVK